jgi:CheY-like chemotaxis protein
MRLRILTRPTDSIDGVFLDHLRVGEVYELGTQVACVFLAEHWAELVMENETIAVQSPSAAVSNIEPLVLVVDDDPDIRRLTKTLLTDHGYHVILAAHGQDAIQRLRQRCPDLIVLDLNMPVMDGWTFRSEQRDLADQKRAAVPVLLMTGEDNATAFADTLQAVGVVKKPFDPAELLNAISAAIHSPGSAAGGGMRS